MKPVLTTTLLLLLAPAAHAGKCDKQAAVASTVKADALVAAYAEMIACDKTEADGAFPAFARSSDGDPATRKALALAAIDAQIYTPVWSLPESIREYSERTELARGVGASCADHPNVVKFLQGAYYGLRDLQFVTWDDALETCSDPTLLGWMESIVASPPPHLYDEKYSAVADAWISHRRADALPVLQRAAVTASANGGPFTAIIDKMDRAVQPTTLGEPIPDADRLRLEEALVAVAEGVGPEQAALVADRLHNAGSEEAAASLLRRVYPDRVTEAGRLLYGAASIESCDGQAIVHYALVLEPAKRWSILADLEGPLRAFKPRLKCAAESPWPIVATSEPLRDADEVDTWATEQLGQWTAKGMDARLRREKDVVLP